MATEFNQRVKAYFRLLEHKRELAEKVKGLNAEMKDEAEAIKAYMDANAIPAIEFGAYNLRLARRSRKQGISEKVIRSAIQNEDECAQLLGRLDNFRENKTTTTLTVRNKTQDK